MRRRQLTIGAIVLGLATSFATLSRSADDDLGLGSGKDGAFTAASANQVINSYAAVTAAAPVGATSVTVARRATSPSATWCSSFR